MRTLSVVMYTLFVILHVLGACVWTGGHIVLSAAVLPRAFRESDAGVIARFERGYERLGIPALLVQVVTGLALAWMKLPDLSRWSDSSDAVARHIMVKLLLLALTIALAVHARFRVLPDLDEAKLRALAWHVVPVTALAVLLAVVGAGLSSGGVL
jgi:putative copper export protein